MSGDVAAFDAFLAEYAARLDEDRLEAWVDLFVEKCEYKIVSRENHLRGLPLGLVWLAGKDMLRDRVTSLREANIYNIHTDRHVVGRARIVESGEERWTVEASYAMFQTSQEGQTRIFSVGLYRDGFVRENGELKLEKKLVIADTAAIPTLLSTPI
jgi:anthranilate 1,2-dioxygenase small subunit